MLVVDPVCEMQIQVSEARWKVIYDQKMYYFCSEGCLAEFMRHPEDYKENANAGEGDGEKRV